MATAKQPVFDISSVPAVSGDAAAAAIATPVVPAPEPYSVPYPRNLGEPDKVWEYRMPDGGLYGVVARWDFETDGKPDKTIRPCIFNGKAWIMAGFGRGRPCYNAHHIAANPGCPVLVVEGEKTADAAAIYLPEGWIATTWSGGSAVVDHTDWSVLAGHPVVQWPDNDGPGVKAMALHQELLMEAGIASAIVPLPAGLPDKWDLADPLPRGTPGAITALLERTLQNVRVPEPPSGGGDDPLPPPEEGIDKFIELRPLGYDGGNFYILGRQSKQVHEMTARALLSEAGLMELMPDRFHWDRRYGNDKGKIDWASAGSELMAQCYKAGVYDPERNRGRGVWMDRKRVVLHLGNKLLIDGRLVDPVEIESEYIYPCSQMLLRESDLSVAATDAEGKALRMACNLLRWENPLYGDLIAGWVAVAVVCGGMKWRTHAWVTGPAGCGKSTVVNKIAAAALGEAAIYPLGDSSEAGIRRTIGLDARPVVFDEAEAGVGGEDRRQAIIRLMRQAASEGTGRTIKAAAGSGAEGFAIRSSFLLASIGVGIREAADETRTVVLTLKALDAEDEAGRAEQEAEWARFLAACDKLPPDLPQKLLARQIKLLPVIRENADTFARIIAANLGNRRVGDQLGTLLAGTYSLTSTGRISDDGAERYLANMDWTEWTQTKAIREDTEIIRHMAAHKLMVDAGHGRVERTIGELIAIALGFDSDTAVGAVTANAVLKRNGLRAENEAVYDMPARGVLIATQHKALDVIMRTSDYAQGYHRMLLRSEGARLVAKATRFAGVQSRAVWVPASTFIA